MQQGKQSFNVAVIDIGTYKIYSSIARFNNHNDTIDIISSCCRKTSGVHGNVVTDLVKLGGSILETIIEIERQAQQSVKNVYVAIPQQFTVTKQISKTFVFNGDIVTNKHMQSFFNDIKTASIGKAFEVLHTFVVRFIVDDKVIVKNPVNMKAHKLCVVMNVVYGDKNFTQNIKRELKQQNIDVNAFVLSQYSSALATTYADERKNGVTVVDIGYDNTSVVYIVENNICEMQSISMGGNYITKSIASMLHIIVNNDAEVIKTTRCQATTEKYVYNMFHNNDDMIQYKSIDKNNNIFIDHISVKRVNSVVSASLDQLFANISAAMRQSKYKSIFDNVIITGGGSKMNGLHEFVTMKRIFPGSVIRIGNPIGVDRYVQREDKAASFATSAGLIRYQAQFHSEYGKEQNVFARVWNKISAIFSER